MTVFIETVSLINNAQTNEFFEKHRDAILSELVNWIVLPDAPDLCFRITPNETGNKDLIPFIPTRIPHMPAHVSDPEATGLPDGTDLSSVIMVFVRLKYVDSDQKFDIYTVANEVIPHGIYGAAMVLSHGSRISEKAFDMFTGMVLINPSYLNRRTEHKFTEILHPSTDVSPATEHYILNGVTWNGPGMFPGELRKESIEDIELDSSNTILITCTVRARKFTPTRINTSFRVKATDITGDEDWSICRAQLLNYAKRIVYRKGRIVSPEVLVSFELNEYNGVEYVHIANPGETTDTFRARMDSVSKDSNYSLVLISVTIEDQIDVNPDGVTDAIPDDMILDSTEITFSEALDIILKDNTALVSIVGDENNGLMCRRDSNGTESFVMMAWDDSRNLWVQQRCVEVIAFHQASMKWVLRRKFDLISMTDVLNELRKDSTREYRRIDARHTLVLTMKDGSLVWSNQADGTAVFRTEPDYDFYKPEWYVSNRNDRVTK